MTAATVMLSTINKEASSQVDFVIARDGNVQELIQVSYDISTERTRNREIRGLKNAAKKLKCGNLTLVTFEERGQLRRRAVQLMLFLLLSGCLVDK